MINGCYLKPSEYYLKYHHNHIIMTRENNLYDFPLSNVSFTQKMKTVNFLTLREILLETKTFFNVS